MAGSIPTPAPYVKAFEQLGFGMFVHYGLYSQLKGGEWVFHHAEDMSMAEYEKLFDTFNPGSMADIVNTAKTAGCKYICLTTRHHDGFSLYDTRGLSDYDAPHSPCRRSIPPHPRWPLW
jgi:alpha-L-fucosidase